MAATLQSFTTAPRNPTRISSFIRRSPYYISSNTLQIRFCSSISVDSSLRGRIYPVSTRVRASNHPEQIDGGDESRRDGKLSLRRGVFLAKKALLSFTANNFLPLVNLLQEIRVPGTREACPRQASQSHEDLLGFLKNPATKALISGVALGLANPSLGCLADKYYLSKFSTFGIFFISGMTLRSGDIGDAAEAWPVGIFGLGSILCFTPFFSRLIMQLQLQPREFITGLAIFSCMPTTLSSGVALTQLAGGNSALALAITVISNLLGILIVPFSISKFIADGVGVSVPTKQLFQSLVLTLLIPLIMGKVARESFTGLANIVDNKRKLFSMINAVFLSLVPWIQVSRSSSLLLMVKPRMFLVAIALGAVLHLVLLAFNAFAIRSLSAVSGGSKSIFAKKENSTALLLVASQKTLPVLVAVVEQLGGAFGESGLLVLPCIAAHLNQIIIDSFLVNFWLGGRKGPVGANGGKSSR